MLLVPLQKDVLCKICCIYYFLSSQMCLGYVQQFIWYNHQRKNTSHTHTRDNIFTSNLDTNCNDKSFI
jgi:hypothetical protein